VLAHKLGRAVYDMLSREQPFDLQRFVTAYPLRGEREPMASLAHAGLSLLSPPSLSTAWTVRESLDEPPEAAPFDWPLALAHLLGEASSRGSWLPRPRV
jgi:hypothetical protein